LPQEAPPPISALFTTFCFGPRPGMHQTLSLPFKSGFPPRNFLPHHSREYLHADFLPAYFHFPWDVRIPSRLMVRSCFPEAIPLSAMDFSFFERLSAQGMQRLNPPPLLWYNPILGALSFFPNSRVETLMPRFRAPPPAIPASRRFVTRKHACIVPTSPKLHLFPPPNAFHA